MHDPLFRQLTDEREQKKQLIQNYADAAAGEGRDLTESEQETMRSARSRISALDTQLELVADDLELADIVRGKLRAVSHATTVFADAKYRSAGALLWDMLHQGDDDARMRYGRAMKRAAEHMGTEATTTVPTAGDLGGLIMDTVRGPIIDPYPGGMPFATALGLTESADSLHWKRPKIVDPNFTTGGVGQQGSGGTLGFEKAELPSKKFDVTADLVPLVTIGGYLNISQQLISLVSGSLDVIVGHMNKRLAYAIDLLLITEMQESTGYIDVTAAATAADILAALYDASAAVYVATGDLAQWVVMGPLGYARLGGLVDLAGRPFFPTLGPVNAPGTSSAASFQGSVAGLRVVVTPAITDDTFWVGNSMSIEGAIYRFPVLEAVEPSVLGRQIAVAAAAAGYRPIPNSAIHLYDHA
jgi:HK97 family phage major capsid protein